MSDNTQTICCGILVLLNYFCLQFDQAFGGGLGLNPTMETSVLMHNIQRIVQVCGLKCYLDPQ